MFLAGVSEYSFCIISNVSVWGSLDELCTTMHRNKLCIESNWEVNTANSIRIGLINSTYYKLLFLIYYLLLLLHYCMQLLLHKPCAKPHTSLTLWIREQPSFHTHTHTHTHTRTCTHTLWLPTFWWHDSWPFHYPLCFFWSSTSTNTSLASILVITCNLQWCCFRCQLVNYIWACSAPCTSVWWWHCV